MHIIFDELNLLNLLNVKMVDEIQKGFQKHTIMDYVSYIIAITKSL